MLILNNQRLCLNIDPQHGSNIVSFKVEKQELIYCDQQILNQHGYTGFYVLFPFPNRVRNKEYTFNHKKYSLKNLAVPKDYHHAFVRGHQWQFKQLSQTISKTWIEIQSGFPCWKNYPWHCCLTLKYTLKTDGVRIDYTVANLDKTQLGFGFGLHPLFKNAATIKVPAKYVMESDKNLLPTGKLFKADLNQLTPVKELNLDHVFTGLSGSQKVVFANGRKLTIRTSSDFTHCVVYTGEKEKFTCVESQTCSTDAHNLDSQGLTSVAHLIKVKPGGSHHGWVEYQIN